MLLQSFLERVERLSYQDAERREALKATIAEAYYSQFDFKPQIHGRAKARETTPVEELVANEKHKARLERLRQQAEQRMAAECTFQPDTRSAGP